MSHARVMQAGFRQPHITKNGHGVIFSAPCPFFFSRKIIVRVRRKDADNNFLRFLPISDFFTHRATIFFSKVKTLPFCGVRQRPKGHRPCALWERHSESADLVFLRISGMRGFSARPQWRPETGGREAKKDRTICFCLENYSNFAPPPKKNRAGNCEKN